MKYNTLLFPRKANQTNFSLFLLSMRLLFGSLLMTHGYAKLMIPRFALNDRVK